MRKFNNTLRGARPLGGETNVFLAPGLFWLLALCCVPALGQADQKEATPEKVKPRISLVSTQLNGDSIVLEATVRVRIDGWQPVEFGSVRFEVRNDTVVLPLGTSMTDAKGKASIQVGMKGLITAEDGSWTFGSVFEGNDIATGGDAELSAQRAGVTFSGEKQDSTYAIVLRLFDLSAEKSPIPDAEVGFFVKRHFSNLKIGEGTTDENGEVVLEWPGDLPGDLQGNLVLIGKAEDLDAYGTVAAVMVKPWGVRLQQTDTNITRGLTSHAPPLWMLIVFVILMGTVWGHYIVIVYKLVRIRKPKIQNP